MNPKDSYEPIGSTASELRGKPRLNKWQVPPLGWYTLGTHVGIDVELEFSKELDEGGLPIWERPKTDKWSQLELIDDAFCDIIQDQYQFLTPEVERSLSDAIGRLRKWQETYREHS